MQKDEILTTLSNKPLHELDEMIQKERLSINAIIKDLGKAREEELDYKYNKRKELLAEGISHSKVENMLRSNEVVYALKKKIIGLVALREQRSNRLEIFRSFYFSNRQSGG